jgi:hypothetical protein
VVLQSRRSGSGSAIGAARPESEVGRSEDLLDRIRGESVAGARIQRQALIESVAVVARSLLLSLADAESRSSGAIRSEERWLRCRRR